MTALQRSLSQPLHHQIRQAEEASSAALGQRPDRRRGARTILICQNYGDALRCLQEPADDFQILRREGVEAIDPDLGATDHG